MKIIILPVLFLGFLLVAIEQTAFAQPTFALKSTTIQKNEISIGSEAEADELRRNWNRSSIEKALEIYLQLAQIKEIENQKSLASKYLREAAQIKIILGQAEDALPLLRKSLKLAIKLKDFAARAETEGLLSYIYCFLGDFKTGEIEIDKALKSVEKTQDLNATAEVHFYAGEFYYSRQRIIEALPKYEESVKLFNKANNTKGEAKSLIGLAYSYLATGNYSLGVASAEKSVQLSRKTGDLREEIRATIALGRLINRMGKPQRALAYYRTAEETFPDDLDSAEKSILLYSISIIYSNYGDCLQAKKYIEELIQMLKKEDNPIYLNQLIFVLGEVDFNCGEYDEALFYFSQVLPFFLEKQLNDNAANSYIKIAETYKAKGDLQEALKNYQSAEKITGILTHNQAKIYFGLGDLFEKKGDLKKAKANYRRSLKLNRRIKYRFEESDLLYRLARIENSENNFGEALKKIEKSVEIIENLSTEVYHSKLKSTYFSSVFERYEFYIGLLMNEYRRTGNEEFAVKALQASEKSRARAMLETLRLTEADFTKDASPELIKSEQEIRLKLNAASDNLTDLLIRKADKKSIETAENNIRELENRLSEIQADMRQNSPIYSAVKSPLPFDIEQFRQKVLDEDSVFLEFSLGKDASWLWLVGKNEFAGVKLPPRKQIEEKVIKLREFAGSVEMLQGESIEAFQNRQKENEKQFELLAGELSRELFGQIKDQISGKRLIIVPDGKLLYFPISGLPFPDSNEPFLLTNEIVYQPSGLTLSMISENKTAHAKKDFLVFSDPIFSRDDERVKSKSEVDSNEKAELTEKMRFVESLSNLQRLPASEDESIFLKNNFGANDSAFFTGFTANRENFLKAATGNYRFIHLATHGLIDEKRPELSGVVFSRFDENGNEINEFIRLQDIYALNLNADLVVLSACNSGIGKDIKGEGLLSLNNAFLQSGAKSVISSVWKVSDNATLEMMKNFYRIMKDENLPASQALRKAQIKMRESKSYGSPFHWAAFTLQGDFREKPVFKQNSDFPKWTIFPLLAILAGGFWLYFRKSKILPI